MSEAQAQKPGMMQVLRSMGQVKTGYMAIFGFASGLPFALFLDQEWGSSAIYAAELAANIFGALTGVALVWWVLNSAIKR